MVHDISNAKLSLISRWYLEPAVTKLMKQAKTFAKLYGLLYMCTDANSRSHMQFTVVCLYWHCFGEYIVMIKVLAKLITHPEYFQS